MCWRSRALMCSAVLCAVLGAQTAPTFRTEVALVHVDAEVVEDGRVLSEFGKDDFRIWTTANRSQCSIFPPENRRSI